MDWQLKHPFNAIICAPTQSGKTTLVKELLLSKNIIIDPPPQRIVYCFGEEKPNIDNIEYIRGLKPIHFDKTKTNLLILDDLMDEVSSSNEVGALFTRGSHRKNLCYFNYSKFISERESIPFYKSKCSLYFSFQKPSRCDSGQVSSVSNVSR